MIQEKNNNVLLLGATGFTGVLIAEYLATHPQRDQFSLILAGRSANKLASLAATLKLVEAEGVQLQVVDVEDHAAVDAAVRSARVVINVVCPYWTYGTPVVRACVKYGVHYVDLTAETTWVRDIIEEFDYLATKTGSIVIPSCGLDSVPSDLLVYLSLQTARKHVSHLSNSPVYLGRSRTAFDLSMSELSAGSLTSFLGMFDNMPRWKVKQAYSDWALSPFKGLPSLPPQLVYTLPHQHPTVCGSFYAMLPVNRAVVHRTWGLMRLQEARQRSHLTVCPSYTAYANGNGNGHANGDMLPNGHPNGNGHPADSMSGLNGLAKVAASRYFTVVEDEFTYDEMMVVKGGRIVAALVTTTMAISAICLAFFAPVRWLLKKIAIYPGAGPARETMAKGWINATNVSTISGHPHLTVKSTLNAKGDPSYLLTAVFATECALALALEHESLPSREGGILTPMSALGDVLVDRLRGSGRFDIQSGLVKSTQLQVNAQACATDAAAAKKRV